MNIAIDQIKPDPNQPRKIFDEKHIEGLAQSIRVEGFINEIEIDQNYQIITGECRYRAALLLGYTEIPARINPSGYSEYERLRHQMAENVHQSGTSMDAMMNPIDTARGYLKLISFKTGKDYRPGRLSRREIYGVIGEVAHEVGVSTDTIHDYLDLLEEPEYVLESVMQGTPRTHFKQVPKKLPEEIQVALKKKIARGDYGNRAAILEDVEIIQRVPDLARLEIERVRARESRATNRILTNIAKLALALDAQPLEAIEVRERGMISRQLAWLNEEIGKYLNAIQ